MIAWRWILQLVKWREGWWLAYVLFFKLWGLSYIRVVYFIFLSFKVKGVGGGGSQNLDLWAVSDSVVIFWLFTFLFEF